MDVAFVVPLLSLDPGGTELPHTRWRDYKTHHQRRVTLESKEEALDLLLNLNGSPQMLEPPPVDNLGKQGVPTVSEVDPARSPSLPSTVRSYQRILDLRIRNTIGHIPMDEFSYREVMRCPQPGTILVGYPPLLLLRELS